MDQEDAYLFSCPKLPAGIGGIVTPVHADEHEITQAAIGGESIGEASAGGGCGGGRRA